MDKTTFLIIRHGQTQWNIEGRMMGISDIPLTEQGVREARKMAKHLKGYRIDVIATSPLLRASQTAKIIATYHRKAKIITIADLRERSFGELEGLVYKEVNTRHPQMTMGTWWHYPNFRPPGGESLEEVIKRAQHALDILLKDNAGKTIVIVSHGALIRNLLSLLLKLPRGEVNKYGFDNASLTVVRYSEKDGGEAHLINNVPE